MYEVVVFILVDVESSKTHINMISWFGFERVTWFFCELAENFFTKCQDIANIRCKYADQFSTGETVKSGILLSIVSIPNLLLDA